MSGTCSGSITITIPCTPLWACELPLNGYLNDGCGNRQLNSACNVPTSTNAAADGSTPSGTIVCYNPSYDPINLTCTISGFIGDAYGDGITRYSVIRSDTGTTFYAPASSLKIGTC